MKFAKRTILIVALIITGGKIWMTIFPPDWIPFTSYIETDNYSATAVVTGLGIFPLKNWIGYKLDRVEVNYFSGGGEKWILFEFLPNGECSFIQECNDGRLMAKGTLIPLENPIPIPAEYRIINAVTYDLDGKVLSTVHDRNGQYVAVDCLGQTVSFQLSEHDW